MIDTHIEKGAPSSRRRSLAAFTKLPRGYTGVGRVRSSTSVPAAAAAVLAQSALQRARRDGAERAMGKR
jgi:hypothetical protein